MSTNVTTAQTRRDHPNRLRFTGVLAHVETPSDKAPSGSRGHRVLLDRKAAEDALWSLEGMAVDFKDGYDGHNALQKCGIIEEGHLVEDELHISGYLFSRDFAILVRDLRRADRPLGMSYELADAHVEDMRAEVWRLTKVTFTGAAILYADQAAYRTTTFSISACDEPIGTNGKLRISFTEADEITGGLDLTTP